jgi:hypothetical protein
MNKMHFRVPKVAESVPRLSVPLVRIKTKIIRDARNVDGPADGWDSGISVLHPEEPGGDRVIRSDADPEEWAWSQAECPTPVAGVAPGIRIRIGVDDHMPVARHVRTRCRLFLASIHTRRVISGQSSFATGWSWQSSGMRPVDLRPALPSQQLARARVP